MASTLPFFPFFDLPRELRDRIYGYSNKEVHLAGGTYGLPNVDRLQFQSLNPQLLTVSRQFKQEYEHSLLHDVSFRRLYVGVYEASSSTAQVLMPSTLRVRLSQIRVMHMTISGNAFVDDTGDGNEADQDIAKLIALTPRLDSLQLEVVTTCAMIEALSTPESAPLSVSTLTEADTTSKPFALCAKDALAKITLRRSLIVYSPLFSPKADALEDHVFVKLGAMNRANVIYFGASTSEGPYAWHGLDLKADKDGLGSFEEATAIALAAEENTNDMVD